MRTFTGCINGWVTFHDWSKLSNVSTEAHRLSLEPPISGHHQTKGEVGGVWVPEQVFKTIISITGLLDVALTHTLL